VRDLPPEELVTALDAALAKGVLGDTAQPDDVALVAVRLVPAPLHGRLPAQPAQLRVMRRAVEAWAARAGLSDDVLDDLQYALGEAAANAVEHAYEPGRAGEFAYAVEYLPGVEGGVAVEVHDEGRWRPVPGDPGHRGRGLQVLEALGHDVRIERGDGGTTVTFRIPPPAVLPEAASPARRRAREPGARDPAASAAVLAVAGADPPTVRVTGDLDLDGVASAGPSLLAAVTEGPSELVIDLRETGFVSSSGVALLVQLAARARERDVVLVVRVAEGSPLARALDVTGLRATLPVAAPS
jgi:anti-anti-sigma factor